MQSFAVLSLCAKNRLVGPQLQQLFSILLVY